MKRFALPLLLALALALPAPAGAVPPSHHVTDEEAEAYILRTHVGGLCGRGPARCAHVSPPNCNATAGPHARRCVVRYRELSSTGRSTRLCTVTLRLIHTSSADRVRRLCSHFSSPLADPSSPPPVQPPVPPVTVPPLPVPLPSIPLPHLP